MEEERLRNLIREFIKEELTKSPVEHGRAMALEGFKLLVLGKIEPIEKKRKGGGEPEDYEDDGYNYSKGELYVEYLYNDNLYDFEINFTDIYNVSKASFTGDYLQPPDEDRIDFIHTDWDDEELIILNSTNGDEYYFSSEDLGKELVALFEKFI